MNLFCKIGAATLLAMFTTFIAHAADHDTQSISPRPQNLTWGTGMAAANSSVTAGIRGDKAVKRWEDTGRSSTAATLRTPWLEIPITGGTSYAHQTEQVDVLPIGGLYAPVSIERVTRRERRVRREAADRDALIKRLSALAVADARARLSSEGIVKYDIARCWTRVDELSTDALKVSAVLEITTNTAVTTEALRQGG